MKVSRKDRVVAPKRARRALGFGTGEELVVEVEEREVLVKARLTSYTNYMLGRHSNVRKGVEVERYVRKEIDA